MLQLYNLDKVKIRGLKSYKDYCIESELLTGDKTLSFLYPSRLCNEVIEESYIRNKNNEFVVKAVSGSGEWKTIVATLNVEDLEGKVFESFETVNKNITESLNLALAGTGWTIGTCDVTRRRTVRKTNSSSWEIIQEAKKRYRVDLEFDSLNKRINIFEKRGNDKGVYFSDTLNLRDLDIQGNSYEFYTRIIAIGKDDIRVTLENFQYSKKVKTFIWKDDRYTDIDSLREDAQAKLNEISKPYRAYAANIIDLSVISERHKILSYGLGDTVTLVSKDKGIKEKQRIAKMVEYPDEPFRNTCEIANITLKFEDTQKEFQDTADTVNNITTDNGTIDVSTINGLSTKQIYDFEASVGKITDLTVVNAHIENLYAEKASIGELNAVIANIGELNATKANITELNAVKATISTLEATTAKITDLTAINAKINVLEVDTASIKNLLAGNITGENIQAGGITSDKLTIENGFITNLMVKSVDVEKINAGTISTNKFIIKSEDGGIEIVGATQQFKDKNNKVRIQMGKDTQGNFNFILRGEDGTTALIDHTGIKKNAIADDLIVKDMIAGDAVGEKQIDYSSFASGFNKDTNTTTLKSTKIRLDNQNQTLDVAFNQLKTQSDGTKTQTESNSTTIGIQQGQINTAINNTKIIKDGQSILLKDDYNRTVATVNSTVETIGRHQSTINEHTGKITGVITDVTEVKKNLDGITQRVGTTETKVNTVTNTVSNAQSEINQLKNKIELKVEASDISTAVSNIVVGGRNLIENSIDIKTSPNNTGLGIATKMSNESVVYWRVVADTTISTYESTIYTYMQKNCIIGKEYTISCDVRIPNDGTVAFYSNRGSNSGIKANIWTNIKFTFVWNKDYRVSGHTYNGKQLDYRKWKLEVGTKATDWTPALEDTDKAIADTITVTEQKIATAKSEIKLETDSIKQSVSSVDNKVTTVTTTANNALTNANKGISDALLSSELAKALSTGKIMNADPTFRKGVNGTAIYNNSGNGNVFWNRIARQSDCPTTSTHCMEYKSIGVGYPSFGGFTFATATRANAVFITKIIAKIPSGRTINWGSNATGTGGSSKWLTSNVGTGKYEEYIFKVVCGSTGGFSSTNFFSFAGGTTPTPSAPLYVIVAYATVFDIMENDERLNEHTTQISTVTSKTATLETNLNSITGRVTSTESTVKTVDGKIVAVDNRLKTAEQKITPDAITNSVSSSINNGGTLNTVSTVLNKNGLTIYNGALTVKNNAGQTVLSGDSNGNLTITGRLNPRDNTVRLFGENCRIDGSSGAIRLQKDLNNYMYVDGTATRFFNGYSNGGSNYVSVHVDHQGHTNMWGNSSRIKLLGNGSTGVQCRNSGDNSYVPSIASAFTVSSRAEYKINIHEQDYINFIDVLKNNAIKGYNYKTEVQDCRGRSVKYTRDGEYIPLEADLKTGLILDDLTEDAMKLLHPQDSDGIDLYAMASVLWKVCQEQQKRIEKLEEQLLLM